MRLRLGILSLVVLAMLAAACTGNDPAVTTAVTASPEDTTVATAVPTDNGLVAAPVRHPATSGAIYFVMTDRFENGDPANDTGGIAGGPLDHGFLPEDKGFYQGGDLAGLTARLPYIAELGMTAIWMTPPFANRPVQGLGAVENSSAGYHGYWQVDWSQIDPHLGTEAEMQGFLAEALRLGIDVYFDIVINHTGDVITYEEGNFSYQSKGAAPYQDSTGSEFDDAAVAGDETAFPTLDSIASFPYTPVFRTAEDAGIKSPDWLDDPTVYHNRGLAAAKDLAPFAIRVNAISPAFIGPGSMWTGQVKSQAEAGSQYYDTDPDEVAAQMMLQVPMRRLGTLNEVAASVLFLLSDDASYLTGVNLEIAGGTR